MLLVHLGVGEGWYLTYTPGTYLPSMRNSTVCDGGTRGEGFKRERGVLKFKFQGDGLVR